ncbi:MAG TPA: hypothetical protein VKF62_13075, partial [Planctomycetota bacterium]|nr:hypothetical protein [Planctomycetota bacterium]
EGHWFVVWEREAVSDSGDNDIRGIDVVLVGGLLTVQGPEVVVEGDAGDDEVNPSVAYTGIGEEYVVAYADEESGSTYDLWAVGIDPSQLTVCECAALIGTSTDTEDVPEIAAQRSGDSSAGDEALIVWQAQSAPDSHVRGRRFRTNAGVRTGVAGIVDCSPVVFGFVDLTISCAGIGATEFRTKATGLPAALPGVLVFGLEQANFDFGCTPLSPIVPNPFEDAFLFPTTTSATGSAEVVLSIPCSPALAGLTLYEQWILFAPCAACPGPGISTLTAALVVLGV